MKKLLYCLVLLTSLPTLGLAHTNLPWWSATDHEMQKAPCKTLTVPSLEDMQDEVLSMTSEAAIKAEVFGSTIVDSPRLINALVKLTKRTGKDGGSWAGVHWPQVNLQSQFSINPHCHNVLCAVEKIWGHEQGIKTLWILLKYGFNTSELAFDNTDRFTLQELNDVIMTLGDVPAFMGSLAYQQNQRLAPIDRQSSKSGTVADSTIILMQSWREKSSLTRQQTLFHELGHNMEYRFLDKVSSEEWEQLSGWTRTMRSWAPASGACFVSRYGMSSLKEDLAEAIVAYRYKGWHLKEQCPEKYEFVRTKIFNNVEYLSTHGQCE